MLSTRHGSLERRRVGALVSPKAVVVANDFLAS
jgi:hypothetical protein